MSYTALYRKFRPLTFDEVRGQDHITRTLKNEISSGRIGHAYLFTGTRGTGKTTVAKVFARAINCESPLEDGSPCGECEVCKAIASGSSLNVVEMDAASNNGVDDVRAIIEEVDYLPTAGRYKVYIIDEVHMFSAAAFNAFLKTLEEPPEHVVFILATTEVHKIPVTILSRCQQYDFRRISIETIAGRMRDIMDREGREIEDRALEYIARKADGSMRDALSLLDRCIAFFLAGTDSADSASPEIITFDGVLEVLGAADTQTFSELLAALSSGDVTSALGVLEKVIVRGREISQFVTDFSWYLRNLLLIRTSPELEELIDLSSENLAVLKEEAERTSEAAILRYIRILSDLLYDLGRSTQKRTLAEIAVIRMMRPQTEQNTEALYQRIDELEAKLASGAFAAAPASPSAQKTPKSPQPAEPQKKQELPRAVPDEVKKLAQRWSTIADSAGGLMRTLLRDALVSVDENGQLLLVYDAADPGQQTRYLQLSQAGKREEIEKLIEGHIGAHVPVKLVLNQNDKPRERQYTDIIAAFEEKTGFKVEIEDF